MREKVEKKEEKKRWTEYLSFRIMFLIRRGESMETRKSDSYEAFAYVYDNFMDNIPYEEWANYLIGLLKEYGVSDGIVVDLGCGTGSMTKLLAKAGYDMIGIDNSIDMLEIAREKMMDSEEQILYLLQDMREFELYGTVHAIVSVCDSMNYITEKEDLVQVFRLANNYLEPRGYFIFDMNTEYKYKMQLGDRTIAEDREDMSFIWENFYDEEQKLNEYSLSIFVQEKEDLYRKYEEVHYQRAYSLEEVKEAIKEAGMEFVAAYDAFTHKEPSSTSERMYIIARETFQENKQYQVSEEQ